MWYQFKGDLKQILENTLNRFQNGHLREIPGRNHKFYRSYQESVNVFRRQEIARLREILRTEEASSGEISLTGDRRLDTLYSFYSKEEVEKVLLNMKEELKKQQEEERTIIREITSLVSERELIRRSLNQENKEQIFTDERVRRLSKAEELRVIEEVNQISREFASESANQTEDVGKFRHWKRK